MNKFLLAALTACSVGAVSAQTTPAPANTPVPNPSAMTKPAVLSKAQVAMLCDTCGVVEAVAYVKRKGKGGAVGMVGGAVAGGLLGSSIGKGDGKTVATVGGAVGGAVVGNEIQKHMTSKKVWATKVKMKDGTVKTFDQDAKPVWVAGNVVKADAGKLTKQP